jgi:hypothetical protein
MLTWFRDNAKIFLIAIVVIFVAMVFLEWGMGGLQSEGAERLNMGRVNGTELDPAAYQYTREEVYSGMESQMQRMGDPSPDNQLALMYNEINDAAFDLLVDRTLQAEYLSRMGWDRVDVSLAEPLLKAQLTLMGVSDPAGYLNEYRNDPNYRNTIYQITVHADRSLFDASVNLNNMISISEMEFLYRDAMTSVQARYIPFRTSPPMPAESELEAFYNENTDLFHVEPGARIRFATFMVEPGEEDSRNTMAMVDSLAIAGAAGADTLSVIRSQLEEITGWSIDMAPGDLSEPFVAQSMTHLGLKACHAVELLSVSPVPSDTTGAMDTLTIAHWEVPLLPGYRTVREAFWDLESEAENILATDIPSYDELMLVDFGEYIIDGTFTPTMEMPMALISFATDTIWRDSIGPVLYVPSFSGGYPALMIARKLEIVPGGVLSLQEALSTNRILLEYYARLQTQASLEAATLALDHIRMEGIGLADYAEAESLEVYTTQQFSPASVRQWASIPEEASYRGLLGTADFADVALSAPEYVIAGPFENNGVAYLAEIITRTGADLPEDRSQTAGFYLSMQGTYNTLHRNRLLESLRSTAEIEDGRESYFNTMDSLRAEYAAREAAGL